MRGPLPITDGTLQYDLKLSTAGRHSLRIHTGGNKHSFRIVVSNRAVEITKNPDPGEGTDGTVALAGKRIELDIDDWQTMRVTFRGDRLTAQVAGASVAATHPVIGGRKDQLNLLVFDGSAGFRHVKVVK